MVDTGSRYYKSTLSDRTETSLLEFNGVGSGSRHAKVVIGNASCNYGDESDFSIIVVVSVELSGNGSKDLGLIFEVVIMTYRHDLSVGHDIGGYGKTSVVVTHF